MSDNPTIGTSSTYQDTSLQGMYQFLRDWLTENSIPIAHSVENFNALINTFFGREQDGVWAVNLMQRHFDTYRLDDGTINPQAAVDINDYLTSIGVPEHAQFDASPSDDSGPVAGAPSGPEPEETATGTGPSTVGGQPIPDIPEPQREGTETINDVSIPRGMRLIRIENPYGSDSGELFYLVGDVFGVQLAYEIGDREQLNAIFGGIGYFNNLETLSQGQFDNLGSLQAGTIDEIIGSTESLQAQFERDMRALGLESPPPWLANDTEAMVTFITGINEGWSNERIWNSLSSTDAFQVRFAGLDVVMDQLGSTQISAGVAEYVAREADIRSALLSNRGPDTDVSQETVSSLIGSGWQAAEVEELLVLERQVRENPEALQNINDILAYQGLGIEFTPDDFVDFLREQNQATVDPAYQPTEIFEAVNDALRFQALLTEGIEVDFDFATELGEGTSTAIADPTAFSQQAQLAAGYIARNQRELDLDKMGLTRDDIVAAMFNDADAAGRPISEITGILEQFARERSKAAQGYTRVQSFIDQRGRPIIQGFQGFTG